MKVTKIAHKLSNISIHLTMRFGETVISTGTGFFFQKNEISYLVTNWHNVTGRSPINGRLLSKKCAIPDNLLVRIPYIKSIDGNKEVLEWKPQKVELYDDEERKSPVWWQHPTHSKDVDVVVLKVDGVENSDAVAVNSDFLQLDKLSLLPGMDVFVLGFPQGLSGGGRFPLWKRGSIASEPDVDIDGVPKLFIDTATREGMSGAPVYAQESGYWAPEGKKFPQDGVFGKGYRFLGCYSGRVGDDNFLAQLGIVYKELAINEIITSKTIGTSSFYYDTN